MPVKLTPIRGSGRALRALFRHLKPYAGGEGLGGAIGRIMRPPGVGISRVPAKLSRPAPVYSETERALHSLEEAVFRGNAGILAEIVARTSPGFARAFKRRAALERLVAELARAYTKAEGRIVDALAPPGRPSLAAEKLAAKLYRSRSPAVRQALAKLQAQAPEEAAELARRARLGGYVPPASGIESPLPKPRKKPVYKTPPAKLRSVSTAAGIREWLRLLEPPATRRVSMSQLEGMLSIGEPPRRSQLQVKTYWGGHIGHLREDVLTRFRGFARETEAAVAEVNAKFDKLLRAADARIEKASRSGEPHKVDQATQAYRNLVAKQNAAMNKAIGVEVGGTRQGPDLYAPIPRVIKILDGGGLPSDVRREAIRALFSDHKDPPGTPGLEEAKRELASVLYDFGAAWSRFKEAKPSSLNLNLKFLGPAKRARLDQLLPLSPLGGRSPTSLQRAYRLASTWYAMDTPTQDAFRRTMDLVQAGTASPPPEMAADMAQAVALLSHPDWQVLLRRANDLRDLIPLLP